MVTFYQWVTTQEKNTYDKIGYHDTVIQHKNRTGSPRKTCQKCSKRPPLTGK